MSPMPEPGDPCPGFIAEPGRCWQMVYSRQMQATHCRESPQGRGAGSSPKGDRWFRVWACPDHLDGLTGLRQFGRRSGLTLSRCTDLAVSPTWHLGGRAAPRPQTSRCYGLRYLSLGAGVR